jgi:hypothetical protein
MLSRYFSKPYTPLCKVRQLKLAKLAVIVKNKSANEIITLIVNRMRNHGHHCFPCHGYHPCRFGL